MCSHRRRLTTACTYAVVVVIFFIVSKIKNTSVTLDEFRTTSEEFEGEVVDEKVDDEENEEENRKLYHPLTFASMVADSKCTTYVGFLSPVNQTCLGNLSRRVLTSSIDQDELFLAIEDGGEDYDHFLARFLRARAFDEDAAFNLLASHIAWHQELKVSNLSRETELDVLHGCSPASVLAAAPHWLNGFTAAHEPMLFFKLGLLDMPALFKLATLETLVRHHVWEQEQLTRLLALLSKKTGLIVDKWVTVIDLKDMRLSQASSSFMAVNKAFIDVDQEHYPERCGGIYIINAPALFTIVWNLIRLFIDQRTARKIQIYATKEQWGPVLINLMNGPEQLLEEYGGLLAGQPSLGVNIALTFSEHPGMESETHNNDDAAPVTVIVDHENAVEIQPQTPQISSNASSYLAIPPTTKVFDT